MKPRDVRFTLQGESPARQTWRERDGWIGVLCTVITLLIVRWIMSLIRGH